MFLFPRGRSLVELVTDSTSFITTDPFTHILNLQRCHGVTSHLEVEAMIFHHDPAMTSLISHSVHPKVTSRCSSRITPSLVKVHAAAERPNRPWSELTQNCRFLCKTTKEKHEMRGDRNIFIKHRGELCEGGSRGDATSETSCEDLVILFDATEFMLLHLWKFQI